LLTGNEQQHTLHYTWTMPERAVTSPRSEGNILHIQGENTGDPFTADIETIRKGLKR